MSAKNYYTAPSNQIVNSIRNNKYYTEAVKEGMIKLYTINPEVQNEAHKAVQLAIKFCNERPESEGFKIKKVNVNAPHEKFNMEDVDQRQKFDNVVLGFINELSDDVKDVSNCICAFIMDIVIDGTVNDLPDATEFTYRYIKLVCVSDDNPNETFDWELAAAFDE